MAKLTGVDDLIVDCPSVEIEVGRNFVCTVRAPDRTMLRVGSQIIDAEGSYRTDYSVVHTREVERDLASEFFKRDARADCPDLVAPKEGNRWTCRVIGADGRRWRALATVTNDQGDVTWRLRGPL